MTGVTSVDEYIASLEEWQAQLAAALRQLVLGASPALHERFKWAEPVYEAEGPVCYFKAHARHLTFGFWRGAELTGLAVPLETSGTKMAHVKLRNIADVRVPEFQELVRHAVQLNLRLGDPTRRRPGAGRVAPG